MKDRMYIVYAYLADRCAIIDCCWYKQCNYRVITAMDCCVGKKSVSKLRESVISLPLLALTDQSTPRGESVGVSRGFLQMILLEETSFTCLI